MRESQATPEDYTNNREYTKGHLTPVSHQETLEDREATYTVTNIVPQKERSNNGPWSRLEQNVLNKFNQFCSGTMYVITGAIPYKHERWLNQRAKRVSIPEYMWSAYCCPDYESNPLFHNTYAAVGRNDPNSGNDVVEKGITGEGYDVRKMSVENLEKILSTKLFMGIKLFHEQCSESKNQKKKPYYLH